MRKSRRFFTGVITLLALLIVVGSVFACHWEERTREFCEGTTKIVVFEKKWVGSNEHHNDWREYNREEYPNSEECGYQPPPPPSEPVYRGRQECVGVDLVGWQEVSYDNGENWEEVPGSHHTIEENSQQCGSPDDEPPTPPTPPTPPAPEDRSCPIPGKHGVDFDHPWCVEDAVVEIETLFVPPTPRGGRPYVELDLYVM